MFGWLRERRATEEKATTSKRERRLKWEEYSKRVDLRLRRAELGAQEFEQAKDAKDAEAADRALQKMREINRGNALRMKCGRSRAGTFGHS